MLRQVTKEEAYFTDWVEGAANFEISHSIGDTPFGYLIVNMASPTEARLWFHIDVDFSKSVAKVIKKDYAKVEAALKSNGATVVRAFMPGYCKDKGTLVARMLGFSEPEPLFVVTKEL